MVIIVIAVIAAILLIGVGAVVKGMLWLAIVGIIALVAAAAMGVGTARRRL